MNWPKLSPLRSVGLVAGALALGGEIWALQQARQQAARRLAALEQKKQEREWLARQSPAPSEANEQAMDEDIVQAGRAVAELRVTLQGRTPDNIVEPSVAKPIDAFFDLASFVEKTRAAAARAQVRLKPDERFGFATHANEGPGAGQVTAVIRQREMIGSLVDALLEAHPRELVGIQRERPPAKAPREQGTGMENRDFFDFTPPVSLRVPGRVESEGFRVEFTGQTSALRKFLNNLAGLSRPAVVRSVEVEPLGGGQNRVDGASAAVPLLESNFSRFTVVVEFVDLTTTDQEGGR